MHKEVEFINVLQTETVGSMHMWASDEVCAGISTLLCMLSPLIKRDRQEKEECEE